jgi:hypothetical protein
LKSGCARFNPASWKRPWWGAVDLQGICAAALRHLVALPDGFYQPADGALPGAQEADRATADGDRI